ncbi:MAG: glycosyltransferase family 39 protein [Oscillospiraceae bacterium]|nr:glycosyltransferase family 39 protein [Oscillospiraceae bacterium]
MLPSNGSYTPENNPIMSPSTRELVRVFFLFLATALISLFFCCFHSPFYRFSIYPDANAYMGVARAVRHGLMPYRDVFDHKGILLYLINYGAGSLFPKSMTGVYLSISLSLAIFLWYGYRIARMFLSTIPSLIATLSLLLFSVGHHIIYKDGGGSAEEYLMPCLMVCLYYLIRLGRYTEKEPNITPRRFFLDSLTTGLFCGVMLWVKYTPLPAVGAAFLILYVYMFTKKRSADAIRSLFGVFLGVITVSLPCLIFLWVNGLLDDAWSIYVMFNFHYIGGRVASVHTAANINNFYASFPHMIVTFPGLLYLRLKTKAFNGMGARGFFENGERFRRRIFGRPDSRSDRLFFR